MVYECKICNYSTNFQSNLVKHEKTKKHRNNVEASKKASLSMVMNQNEPQMNQNEPAMNQNEPAMNQNEPPKKQYKCNYCDETFTTMPSRVVMNYIDVSIMMML